MSRTKELLKEELIGLIDTMDLFAAQDLLIFLRNRHSLLSKVYDFIGSAERIEKAITVKSRLSNMMSISEQTSINLKEIEQIERTDSRITIYMVSDTIHKVKYSKEAWDQLHEYV